eukprot:10436251-Heterocapsa_arctica.AAC.1
MNTHTKGDVIKWMNNNPEQKENAAMPFDRELMKKPNTIMNAITVTVSGRIFDAVTNNRMADKRNPPWHPLDRWHNQ